MIDPAKLIPGDEISVPSNTGFDRTVTVHHLFEANGVNYLVAEWRNHFGQSFFEVFDGHQIRGVVNAKDSDRRGSVD